MTTQLPRANASRAVLIASGTFTDGDFTDLDAVERTAKEIRRQLRDTDVWGVSFGHCSVVTANDCTREELLEVVREASQEAEDTFVLYFAGHGVNGKGRLLLPLPFSKAGQPSTMLDFAELMEAVNSGRAKSKIVLIDCCHAGLAMGSLPFEQHVAGEPPEGCHVIAACEANRTAKSPQGQEFTAFGRALISCLAKGGPADQEFWSPAQLLARVTVLLEEEGYPQPVTNSSPVGDLPWVKNRGYEEFYEAAELSGPPSGGGAPGSSLAEKIRYLGPDPLPMPTPFIGRDELLDKAGRLVRTGRVLPVTGREQVGKSAVLTALVARSDTWSQLSLPPAVLEIEPSSAAEKPLMEAIARALHQTLEDSEISAVSEPRTDRLLDLVLPRQVKGRSLILVIKASHIDLGRPELKRELAELLGHDVFKRAAVIVESTDPVEFDEGRWRPQPFPVPALTTPDALRLIGDWLTAENLVTDVEALELVSYDDIIRRPGIIERAVRLVASDHRNDDFDSFLAGRDTASAAAQEVPPEDFDKALMEAAEPTIAGALEKAWSMLESAESTEAHAVLTVWGVMNDLPLSVDVLQGVGLPNNVLRVLFNEGVLVPWRPAADAAPSVPCLEISPVSREALRSDLRRTVRSAAETGVSGALDDLDQRLTAASRLLASAVLPDGRADGSSEEVPQVIEVLRRATGWLDCHVPDALAGLRYLLGLYVNSQYTDALLLPVAQTIDAAPPAELTSVPQDTAAVPVTSGAGGTGPSASGGEPRPWERIGELYAAAGRLNLASRASAQEPEAGKRFLAVFEYAVSLLEACGEATPWHVLRAVDQCGFHGARRYRVFAEIVPARVRLARQLAAAVENRDEFRLNHLLWSISWTLNTGAAQVTADDREGAGQTLVLVERLLDALPPAPDARARQTRNWLNYRLAGLRRATAVTAGERRLALRSAYGLARENTLLAVGMPDRLQQWTHNLLMSGHAYAQEIRDDRERLDLAEKTMFALEEAWGPRDEWAMSLLSEAVGFLRQVHSRHADSELQYAGAREVLALLQSRGTGNAAAQTGPASAVDADHMIELAEAYAFLAYALRERNDLPAARQNLQRGIHIARQVAKAFPSGHVYRTWLRLLRTKQDWFGGGRGRNLLPEYAAAVEEVRAWLESGQEVRYGNQLMALLHLWCLDSDWRREGSLPVAAKSMALHARWNTGRSPEHVRADQVHRLRSKALQAHERVYGRTWGLYDARYRLTREYQHWTAIYAKHPQEVDHAPVWQLLDEAKEAFPRNPDVDRARAKYHRYIWEYGAAAKLYAKVAQDERDGDRFRRGLIDASECLLSQALYEAGMPAEARVTALRTASDYLQQVAGLHSQAHRVSLLSARIALELDRPVDWDLADSKFSELIGDDYVGNMGRHLNERRNGTAEPAGGEPGVEETAYSDAEEWDDTTDPSDSFAVDDLLEENFTDTDVLKSLGSLYLRRSILSAERGRTEALVDAWRAYNCFDGRRVMETSQSRSEKVDTAFLRGQTITWAAELDNSVAPFPGESGRRGWLNLAESRLHSARSRSAGGFHELVCTWHERLMSLKSTLNAR